MSKFFIAIYDWFGRHPRTFYGVLAAVVVAVAAMASQISMNENISNFFGNSGDKSRAIFENLEAKDKIVVMLSGEDTEAIIEAADLFVENLQRLYDEQLIRSVISRTDDEFMDECISFVYDYLPIFLDDEGYADLESKTTPEAIGKSVGGVYDLLASPSGMFVGDVVLRDPLGIGTGLLKEFEQFSPNLEYEIYDGRLFTKDLRTMFMFMDPTNDMGDTGRNNRLVTLLEEAEAQAEVAGVTIDCFGGPIVAVYNARQIKRDTAYTMTIALAVILMVLLFSFRNRWVIPLIVIPPAFGAIFALAMVWLIKGSISAIAIGAGTVVLGISLSYSIHIVSHSNHISSPRQILEELSMPLVIGSFTTIGAFAALMFTSSALLYDMGLFAVFALIGTTLFCLIFMPQFLKKIDLSKQSPLLNVIERAVGYGYDTNRWVVGFICVCFAVSLFYWGDVRFSDNLSSLNYVPEHIAKAEARMTEIFGGEEDIYIVTSGDNMDSLSGEYSQLKSIVESHLAEGDIRSATMISNFAVAPAEQQRRIERWNSFWAQHREATLAALGEAARKAGFRDGAFAEFERMITREYEPCGYSSEEIGDVPVVSEWISSANGSHSLLCRIAIDDEHKHEVYRELEALNNVAVVDRAYFSERMVETTNNDFNYILLVSSVIVFAALLLSYGRLELTLLTFLPMCISWVIILGVMALCDIEFNIVNIILATFIFGLGDDFSIFTMDGLIQEYKSGHKVMGAHKTAIFFSAFTAIVGMGVLIFAQHPALKSIAFISVLGLAVVVVVAYTVQPMLFRLLISNQTRSGGFPYTLPSIFNTIYCFGYFLIGCVVIQLWALVLIVLPVGRRRRKTLFHSVIYRFTRLFLRTMITVRTIRENPYGERFDRPSLIIANHQSFVDILLLLSTTPKIVMVTNSWVWHSPFFGWIVRYADFLHSSDGYEALAERLKGCIEDGYSVVVFPEGTRSADCSIKRFHKGAFYLAQLLGLDILPIVIYGTGHISAKRQGFYIKRGIIAERIMQRVACGDSSMGVTYQEQARNFRQWFIGEYRAMEERYDRTSNPYFRDALIKNYIYKGPVLEWYMRIKCRIDGYYDMWDRIIPRNAAVTDVGCGYGQMCIMLGMLSRDRQIVGIDYDETKIEIARRSFLRGDNVGFRCADMRMVDIPASDAILFNDSLHYVDVATQIDILRRAVGSLSQEGMIIIRDGDASRGGQTTIDRTEVWSTKILKFNRVSQPLEFSDAQTIRTFAEENGLDLTVRQCDAATSETLYILRRR